MSENPIGVYRKRMGALKEVEETWLLLRPTLEEFNKRRALFLDAVKAAKDVGCSREDVMALVPGTRSAGWFTWPEDQT